MGGVLTRFVSLPLVIIMIVAILTAKLDDISSMSDFYSLSEFTFILLLLWLVIRDKQNRAGF